MSGNSAHSLKIDERTSWWWWWWWWWWWSHR